jgi:F-type H+-transporting ATPase subunit b
MPQLEFGDFAPQLIWLVITFGVMYFLMARVALPRIANVIEERRDRIANDLALADQLRQETEFAIATYEQALAEARARAQQIVQETRNRLNAELDYERAAVEARIAERIAEAEAQVNAAKDEALNHIGEIATETAGALVRALIDEKVDPSRLSKAVDQALAR